MTDQALSVRYIISDDASQLLCIMQRQLSVEHIVRTIAKQRDIPLSEARSALYLLLSYLDNYGGVIVYDASPYEWLRRVRVSGFWRVRYPGSRSGFVRSMAYAYGWPLLLGTVIFGGLQWAAGPELSGMWMALPGMLLTSCVVHEMGHALAAHYLQVSHVFIAKPGFAAVIYSRPKYSQERIIAACGPLLAALLCVLATAVVDATPGRFIGLTTCLIHLCSLLPWTADGKTIWRKI